jgi:hypothetical protein
MTRRGKAATKAKRVIHQFRRFPAGDRKIADRKMNQGASIARIFLSAIFLSEWQKDRGRKMMAHAASLVLPRFFCPRITLIDANAFIREDSRNRGQNSRRAKKLERL